MTRLEYLLQKLIEECSEVQKEACKAIIFGLNDKHPREGTSNKERLQAEVQDLYASLNMIHQEFDIDFTPNEAAVKRKIAKVNKYYQYSQNPENSNSKTGDQNGTIEGRNKTN